MPGFVKYVDRYTSDRASADNSIRVQIQFVMDNMESLKRVDRSGWKEKRANEIFNTLLHGGELTEYDRRDADSLYESVWKGSGELSIGKHIDKKRRGLRFG